MTLMEKTNRKFLTSESIDSEIVVFCIFLYLRVPEKGEQSLKYEEPPCGRILGRQPVGQESVAERPCQRHHRPRALRIAPVCKELPAARAQGLRH